MYVLILFRKKIHNNIAEYNNALLQPSITSIVTPAFGDLYFPQLWHRNEKPSYITVTTVY